MLISSPPLAVPQLIVTRCTNTHNSTPMIPPIYSSFPMHLRLLLPLLRPLATNVLVCFQKTKPPTTMSYVNAACNFFVSVYPGRGFDQGHESARSRNPTDFLRVLRRTDEIFVFTSHRSSICSFDVRGQNNDGHERFGGLDYSIG
jgi:hypothetical protein